MVYYPKPNGDLSLYYTGPEWTPEQRLKAQREAERMSDQYKHFMDRVDRINDTVRKNQMLDRWFEQHPQQTDPRTPVLPITWNHLTDEQQRYKNTLTPDQLKQIQIDRDMHMKGLMHLTPDQMNEFLVVPQLKPYRNFDVPPGQSPTHQLPGQAHNLTPPGWNQKTVNPETPPTYWDPAKGMPPRPTPLPPPFGEKGVQGNIVFGNTYQEQQRQQQVDKKMIDQANAAMGLKTTYAPPNTDMSQIVYGPASPPTTIGKYGGKKKKLHKAGKKPKKEEKIFYGI
jgi:hypothetical protein